MPRIYLVSSVQLGADIADLLYFNEGGIRMKSDNTTRALEKEKAGWLTLAAIMIGFPILFLLCVYFPIWMGWASRW
jgi:hypothetical protein